VIVGSFDSASVRYVAAAYAVVWLVTLLYVWLIRGRLGRLERQVEEAERELAARAPARDGEADAVAVPR
jgi:CcmD family protein